MALKFAFVGFRHGHITDLYRRAVESTEIQLVASCEEDEGARKELAAEGKVGITHSDFEEVLAEVSCDVVAIGDYFVRRGSLAVRALSEGKHVIVDKPLCTSLDELDEIERLSREKGLKVGCMLTQRDSPGIIGVRRLVREGAIGEVHAITFGGQHPLSLGSRPGWYFEPGKHGGTITDIGIHAADAIPWITGLKFAVVHAARCWNAFVPEYPDFEDGGQMMLSMDNGCGVLGDVSYHAPSHAGYTLPLYWRTSFFGRRGILETSSTAKEIAHYPEGEKESKLLPLPEGIPGGYLESFLSDIRGEANEEDLCTEAVLRAARTILTIQKAADDGARDVPIPMGDS
jgi:predicted dehydrogenase